MHGKKANRCETHTFAHLFYLQHTWLRGSPGSPRLRLEAASSCSLLIRTLQQRGAQSPRLQVEMFVCR